MDLRGIMPVCPHCGEKTRHCKLERDGVVTSGIWCRACKHFYARQEDLEPKESTCPTS